MAPPPDAGARLLSRRPGFGVASRVEGERLELAGRHRFSRYRLVFALAEDASGRHSG